MTGGWWFEDARPGLRLRHPLARTIGPAEHVWLAWISNNQSDIHGNAHRAAMTDWAQPLVLGALTAAVVIGLAQPAEPASEETPLALANWHSITLGRAVVAGDTLRAFSDIRTCQPVPAGGGYVERTIMGLSQRGEVVVTIDETCFAPARRARAFQTKDC